MQARHHFDGNEETNEMHNIYAPPAFRRWLRDAPRGSVAVYHTGFLANDRLSVSYEPGDGSFSYVLVEPLNELADLAYSAWKVGNVHLFQRKLADGIYDYLAIRR